MDLASARWPDLADRSDQVLLVPIGSCEQHGPHLPLDTDTRIAVGVATQVAAVRPDTWVAPAVTIGASGEHQGFPGTLSIGSDGLRTVLVEVARSALPPDGGGPFAQVVFVNGHGGNAAAVGAAVRQLRDEGRAVQAWSPSIPDADAHAGEAETSILLALHPDAVGEQRPVGATEPLADLAPRLRRDGVRAVSDNGVLGDARGSSAERGRRLLRALVDDLHGALPRRGAS